MSTCCIASKLDLLHSLKQTKKNIYFKDDALIATFVGTDPYTVAALLLNQFF